MTQQRGDILPDREAAERMGWKYQVQWVEAGKPCFIRCKSGEEADRHADKIRKSGASPRVIDLRDSLQGRKKKIHQRRGVHFEITGLPARFWELGRRMTEAMMRYQLDRISLHDMLANAYLQGVQHGYEACENRFVPSVEHTHAN